MRSYKKRKSWFEILADETSDFFNRIRKFPRRVWRWIEVRTIEKYHVVHLGTKPGFSDAREMLLLANFAVLVHFVEIELANMEKYSRKYSKKSYRGISNRELGLSYLSFWSNLGPQIHEDKDLNSHTREYARETMKLYIWWKDERPNRVDPYDVEYAKFAEAIEAEGRELFKFIPCDDDPKFSTIGDDLTEEERTKKNELREGSRKIEEQWDREDQEMLHRLIDIRFDMWS